MNHLRAMLIVLLAICFHPAAIGQQPVLHYTFDEENGDALDSGTAPPANGVLATNATRTSDTPGGFSRAAADLSAQGLESVIDAGDVAKVDTLTQFTMTTWINLQGLNTDHGGSGNVRLLAKQAGSPDFDGFSWNLNTPTEGDRSPDNFRLGMFIGGEEGFGFGQSSENLGADDSWTFVAVTYDGTEDLDNMWFYVGNETDAVTELGEVLSVFAGQVKSTSGSANFGIGFTDAAIDVDLSINGYQDDVRVYDSVLTKEQIEAIRLENLGPSLAGDFDGSGVLDAPDINLLTEEVRAGTNTPLFDVTGDGLVNDADREEWVVVLRNTFFGDSNLDDEFNSSDFVTVFQAGEYEDELPENSKWETGDWNGDGDFDSSDFVTAFQQGGYEMGPRQNVAAVPEPSSLSVIAVCSLFMLIRGDIDRHRTHGKLIS